MVEASRTGTGIEDNAAVLHAETPACYVQTGLTGSEPARDCIVTVIAELCC